MIYNENYPECIDFYKNTLGLKKLFQKKDRGFELTCFDFNDSYLMVETGGWANDNGKGIEENPTKLRFNVNDIEEARLTLERKGIKTEITKNAWGPTINIFDPDGNRISIRDELTFSQQIGT